MDTYKSGVADKALEHGAEIINEDSYFFWTFNPQAVPEPELKILEAQFGDWLYSLAK